MNTILSKLMGTSFKRTKYSTTKFFSFLTLLLMLGTNGVMGQTNPTAFALSGGSFTFTTQTATNTAYPTNMQGWTTGTNNITAITTAAPGADQSLVASGSATTSGLSNLGSNGFNFLPTSSSPNRQVGAICVSLNTTGRSSILVSWLADDQTSGSTREMNISLQYRIGTSGTFTDVSSSTYTTSNNSDKASQSFSNIALPGACENQSVVQIRWITYESASQTGSRDAIRLDEITISSSVGSSSSSNIILNTGFTHPTNIDYTAYQAASGLTTGNSIEVGRFDIQDGGGSSDADALATTLTACSLTVANSANIRALALFDGSTNVGEITSVGVTAAFSGLTLAAADNGSKTFSVRATFKGAITDNQQISFTVASATASGSGSGFAAANAGGAATSTSGDNNKIEVATTDIIFDQNVSTVSQNAVMNPSPTVRAIDGNANYDLDNTSNVVLTIASGSTTFDASATTTVSMVAGVATFSNLVFSTAANTNTLTATQGATSDASSSFNVTASAPEINVKQNVTSLASGSGSHAAGSIVSGNSGSAITFTIENLGSANLTYSSIINSNTTDFTLNTASTSSPISASGTTTFTVTFNPTSAGAKSTTITINNNDADEGTYTFTVTGTGTVSAASDIITNGGYLYSSNIDYASFQTASTLTTGNSVGVASLTIQDGAGAADADNLGTTLTAISLTTGGSTAIRTAALFDGSINVSEVAVNGATTISFSGLTLNASDASTKNFELRVTYQASVTDNQQITFTVSSASASATTSGFAAANAGAAVSTATSDINRLEVTATSLAFVQQVSNVSVNTAMTSAPTVSANDVNGNRDLDYVTDMTATTSGTFAGGSTNTVTPSAGLGTFNNLQFSTAALARTIDVGSGILSNSGNSNTFNIFEAQPTVQASAINFTNVGMNSMTINWTNGDGANRIVVVKATGTPGTSTDGVTYTANTIMGSGSTFGASEFVVYNGTGNTVDITNLLASTAYSVKVFEYNGSAGTENYLTTSNNTSQTTSALTYYSNGSGDPASTSSWKTARNGTGTSPSNFTSGETFIIESGDNMTTTATWSISGTGSKLQIENGGTLTANNAITLAAATTFQIDNGGTYNHNNVTSLTTTILAGVEVFGASSNFIFNSVPSGFTSPSAPGYGNLSFNTTTNGTSVGLSSTLTQVQGNLTFTSTGTGAIRYALLGTGSTSLSVGGNLNINGATALFYLSSGTGTANVTVAGDVIVSAGIFDLSNSSSGGAGTLNIGGNFNQSGGTIKSTSSNTSTINFTGTGKTFTQSGGTLTNTNINWAITNGASLTLINDLPVATTRTLTIGSGSSGILDCGTLSVSGAGSFALSSGATLKTAHASGISGAITATTKSFSSAANYEFNGASTGTFTTTPTANTVNNLTINRSAGVTLSQNLAVAGALTQTSGKLSIGAFTLTLNGTYSGDASNSLTGSSSSNLSITANSNNIYFDQTTPGTTNLIKNLTISGAGTTTLANALNIAGGSSFGVVTVGSGATLATGGNLTLKSTATGTAAIGNSAGTITGNITIERFMSQSGRRWRYISAPVSGQTLADWGTKFYITGPGTPGATIGSQNSNGYATSRSNLLGFNNAEGTPASVRIYNRTTTGTIENGWANPASNMATTLTPGVGYRAFIRGHITGNYATDTAVIGYFEPGAAPTQSSFTFTQTGGITNGVNAGSVSMPINSTGTDAAGAFNASTDGWNLLGNPYPCAFDWLAFWSANTNRTNIANVIYIFDATANSYKSYNTSSGGSLTSGIIPSGSAFFVQATGTGASLTFTEAFKTSSAPIALHKKGTTSDELQIKYYRDSTESDQYILKMINGATLQKDDYDIIKLKNDNLNLSSYGADSINLTLSSIPVVIEETKISLNVEATQRGTYKFDFNSINDFDNGISVSLLDKFTQKTIDIRKNPIYSFVMDSLPHQWGKDRFVLILNANSTTTSIENENSIINTKMAVYPNPASDVLNISISNANFKNSSISIYNVSGSELLNSTMNGASAQLNIEALSSGVYFVKVKNENGFDRTVKFIK
jgi:hypothetical protein